MPTAADERYVDLYLLPVARDRIEAYREQALAYGALVREHGGLACREWVADGEGDGNLPVADGLVQTSAVAELSSRAHRDEVMERVEADPRTDALTSGEQPADMEQVRHGGFLPLAAG